MSRFNSYPLSLKFIWIVLALKVVLFLFISMSALFFIGEFSPNSGLAGFKVGALESLGMDPNHYGTYEASFVIGRFSVFAFFPALALFFLAKRKRVAFKISLLLVLLTSLGGLFTGFVALVMFGISFRKSVDSYFGS